MTLSHGRGPLSAHPAGHFSAPLPDNLVYVEPHPRRVVATDATSRAAYSTIML